MSKSLPPPPRPSSYHPRSTNHYPSGPSGSSGRGSRTPPPPLPHQLAPLSTLSEGPMTLAPGPPSAAGSSVSAASVNPDAALSSADMDPHLAQFGGESLGPPGATRRPTRRVRSIERTWAWVKSRSSVYEPGFVLEVDEDAILDPGPSRASRAARPMTIHAAATNLIPDADAGATAAAMAQQRRQSDVDPDERRRRRQGLTPESGLRPPPRPRPASRVFASPTTPASSSPTTPTSSLAGGISGGSLNALLEHDRGGGRATSVTPTNPASSGRHLARPVMATSASTSTVPTVSKPFPTTGGAPPRPPGPKRVQSISDIVRRHSSAVALAEESAKDRARAELASRPDLVERARAAKAAKAAAAAAAADATPSTSASAPATTAPTPTSPPAPPAPPPVNPPAPGHRREASLASFHSAQSTGTSDTDSVVRDFRLAQAAYDHLNKPSASAPASPQTNTQAQFQKSPSLPRPPSALAAQPVHSAPRRAPSLEQSGRYYTTSSTARERSQVHSPTPGTDALVRSPSLLSPKSASPLPPDDDAQAMALYLRQPQLNRVMHVPRPYPDRPLQVSFADLGKADGRPVLVFLGLGCVRYMCALYDDLARALGLRLICIDRWGLGKTDQVAQENRGPLDWADVVHRVVDDLGIERFQVVAHSAGAPYALATVLKMERRVHGKIHLLAPWVGGDVEGYKWLKWVPNGVIKSALAAEWRLESYFMGKAPTVKAANNGRKEGLNGRSNKDAMVSTTSLDSDASRSRSSFAHDLRPQSSADSRLEHEGFDSFSSDLYSSLGWNTVAPSPFANVTSSPNFLHALNQASHAESLSGTTADLLSVILGRDTKPWGFAYTDIRNPCKIWYGADDDRVSEKSMRWMERAMDAELTVVPDEGHNLMSSRTVMYDVLDSLAEEYRSL